MNIIHELLVALDTKVWAAGKTLASLYEYMLDELLQAWPGLTKKVV